jgi:DNA mismatch endonuclease, patch repair protein
MQANRGRDTTPERAIRSELHRRGLRYRIHVRPISTRRCEADVVFRKALVAVFVDGCWWHGCPDHRPLPKKNREWWARKIQVTVDRDRRNDQALADAGWTVIRVWEHENSINAADRIQAAVLAASFNKPSAMRRA